MAVKDWTEAFACGKRSYIYVYKVAAGTYSANYFCALMAACYRFDIAIVFGINS